MRNIRCITLVILVSFTSCKKEISLPEIISETTNETKVFNNTAKPSDMSFANEDVGFISGSYEVDADAAVIAKTTDGGATWQRIPIYIGDSPSALIRNVFAKSIDSVYATYTSQDNHFGVCFSKDGGYIWSNLGVFTVNSGYTGIWFKNSQVGFVCRSGEILQTKDGGNNWTTVFNYNGFGGIGKLFFTSDRIGYAYGGFVNEHNNSGTLVKTTDGGDTWKVLTSIKVFVSCLNFVDDNIGYAFTYNDNIYKTTDGGSTWILLNNLTGQGHSYYSAVVKGKTMYFGSGSSIFKTTDDFKTIKKIYSSIGNLADFDTKAVRSSENCIFFLSTQQSVVKININK